jgi:hypothetical protein
MSARRMWVFSPNSGGKKIPDLVRIDVEKRINDVAEQQLKGTFVRLDLSFKGQFCYIDAFTEPAVDENWDEEIFQETREEHVERLRNSPLHLCRLRHFDKDKWGFAYYNYSSEKYELATYPDGEFFGKPEDAFLASAAFY